MMLARKMPPCSGGYHLILLTVVFFQPGKILWRKRTRIDIGKRCALEV
ncbi:hypothetical protein LNP17_12010 [Klebsiella variicola subsp. variicola]|nr:hypothetical protein [Klebsiella variicola subsp. variicola]